MGEVFWRYYCVSFGASYKILPVLSLIDVTYKLMGKVPFDSNE
jgi:hypothetical protein